MQTEQLTIRQTPTGYWSVQRGATHVAGAVSRKGAEAEREMLRRLGSRRHTRTLRRASGSPRSL
jgi:hypothetical protein